MADIIPAILEKTFDEIEEKVSLIHRITPEIQIDVCDGAFVPSKTWPLIKQPEERFEAIVAQEEGMPFWEDCDYEFDLMVKDPAHHVADFIALGANRIVIHDKSASDKEIENLLKEYNDPKGAVSEFDIALGVAIHHDTSDERMKKLAQLAAYVQFMGIKNVGFQGQSFDESVIARIKLLRKEFPELIISVDGGVNENNAAALIEAGANRLVVGSAIWESETPTEALKHLQELAK